MKTDKSKQHFFYAFVLHVIILTVFIVSYDYSGKTFVLKNTDKNSEIVNAVIIDAKIESPKPTLMPPKAVQIPKKVIAQPKPLPAPPPPQKKETVAIPDPAKKQLQIEKQLLAEIKQQKELEKKAKQKSLEAAFEKELKATAAKTLEQQLKQEAEQLTTARVQNMQGIVDKYKALILQAISQNWLVPSNVNKKLSSELMIRVAPGGLVLDVQVVRTSGDPALDRSARAAVFKASPLPVPSNSEEFEPFRQFVLKVKPENITSLT